MSYIRTSRRSLGALGDDASEQIACIDRANASSKVAAIDAEILKLAGTWKPTGYYRPSDVQTLLDKLADEAAAAGDALAKAPRSTGDADSMIRSAFDDLGTKYKDRSRAYERAVAEAAAKGAGVINAPGLKDWVIASMRAISDAYVTATVLQCRLSWLESFLDRGYKAMVAIGALAARILGVVWKFGEAVVDAVDTTGDILAFIIKYGPYAAVGLGGYILYNMAKKRTQ